MSFYPHAQRKELETFYAIARCWHFLLGLLFFEKGNLLVLCVAKVLGLFPNTVSHNLKTAPLAQNSGPSSPADTAYWMYLRKAENNAAQGRDIE